MKLWIDDVRPAPEGWTWVKSFDEAVEAFQANAVTAASFDHDLGFVLPEEDCNFDVMQVIKNDYDWELPTGYDLIKWVVENDKWPSESVAVHSMNPTGFTRICGIIERYGPYEYREKIVYEGPDNYKLRAVRYS